MSLVRKKKLVVKLFEELAEQTARFKVDSGIKCKTGCGECCNYPKIHATVLEFIPYAYKMVIEERALDLIEKLERDANEVTICTLFHADSPGSSNGRCSDYENRGLICRLYGYSANYNKEGGLNMITCSIIKTNNPEVFRNAESLLARATHLPIASEYYSRLQAIDLSLSLESYPVNVAIRKALEYVLSYYTYRNHPK